MAQPLTETLNLQISGLYLNPSTFTKIPLGALHQADNVVIDRENIISYRRGMDRYGDTVGGTAVTGMFSFANDLLIHTADDKMWYDSDMAGTWTQYAGTYPPPAAGVAGSRVRSVESNKNFYFLTSSGTQKLDQLVSTPRLAGAPQGLSGQAAVGPIAGFLANNTSVAYRAVWGYRDVNNNLILGAPSERMIVTNTSGATKNVVVTIQIPEEIDTTWFVQLYRSLPSAITVQPNDELQQVFEGNPTAGDITAGSMAITDDTPDSLMQGFIYTAQSQGGILQSNYRPPFAQDACFYKNFVFYANTRTVQRMNQTLTSVDGTLGLQINDIITFTDDATATGFTLTAKAAENAAAGEFAISSTADPAYDIQQTALSICKIMNVYTSNTFLNGYYVSDYNGLPGQMTFEKRSLDPDQFYITSDALAASFTPTVPLAGDENHSSSDVSPNRAYYSKELQPEAVPILNFLEVGSKNQAIERIVPLRDGIIVLKQDGVFRISGNSPDSFVVSLLDNTTRILAANSADVLDNQVYFLSNQGVVAASDNSVQIMSRPIERELLRLTSPALYPNSKDLTFGVSYNADRKYILHLPIDGTDEYCGQQYCYNTITATWTRWTRRTRSAIVFIGTDKLYFGGINEPTYGGYVYQERKTYTDADFVDEQYDRTITAFNLETVTLNNIDQVVIGSQIVQESTGASGRVTAISGSICTVTPTGQPWGGAACIVYTPINGEIQTVQIDADNAGAMKQFSEASFIFSETNFSSMKALFSSDQSGSEYQQVLIPLIRGGWGSFNWGSLIWGGNSAGEQQRIRKLVPAAVQRANWIYIRLQLIQCFSSFGLSGISIGYNKMSQRQK